MIKAITAHTINTQQNRDFDLDIPAICPHCGVAIDPSNLSCKYLGVGEKREQSRIFLQLLCNHCLRAFSVEYSCSYKQLDPNQKKTIRIGIFPELHTKVEHTEEIKELSPMFVQIYSEAHTAEESNLKEICGMGYRKALEFLIKDYAIKLHPDDEETIKSTPLAKCIDSYIDNSRIKSLAKASAWLGNDETHYVRKHDDYDLESLKAFLKAAESFIDSELQAIKADELLKNPK